MGGECSIEEECQEKSAVQCESPDTRERGACRYLDGVPNCQQRVLCLMFVETAVVSEGLSGPPSLALNSLRATVDILRACRWRELADIEGPLSRES
jgi:hypothetical protein